MLNADALVGSIGELLGHNVFSYCKNNPVNMEDSNGYYPTDIEGVRGIIRESAKGYEFMKEVYNMYPGFTKNTEAFKTSFGNRIPDIVNKRVIGEIKNVKYQYYSSQIKGFMELAKNEGKKFVLVVKEGAKLSKPLVKAIENIEGKIIKLKSITPLFFSKNHLETFMRQLDPNAVY